MLLEEGGLCEPNGSWEDADSAAALPHGSVDLDSGVCAGGGDLGGNLETGGGGSGVGEDGEKGVRGAGGKGGVAGAVGVVSVDMMSGEHLSRHYLALNPKHSVPMLRVCTGGARRDDNKDNKDPEAVSFSPTPRDPLHSVGEGGEEYVGGTQI